MAKKTTDFDVVREIALALPDVEETTIHGALCFKLRGKLLTCQALEQIGRANTLAVRIDFDQRAKLLAADPSLYYVTDHYMNYPTVLVRLLRIDRKSLTDLIGLAWGFVGSKTKASGRRGPRRPQVTKE
jgi:hypothetical protein